MANEDKAAIDTAERLGADDEQSIELAALALEERIAETELDLRDRLRIEPEALQEEFVRCPADIAYLAAKNARAIGEHLRARARAKRLRGFLWLKVRNELIAKGYKATVEEIKSALDSHPDWVRVSTEEDNTEALRELARGAVTAVLAKKDMLVQMGANQRAELERDPVLRDREKAARMMREGG